MKTFFIQHRSPHHAKNSGYDRILDFYPGAIPISGHAKLPYILARFLAARHNQKAGLYNSDSIYKELELARALKHNKQAQSIVHYLNAERDIRHVIMRNKHQEHTRFCGTFHKPPVKLDWRVSDPKYVSRLDGAIAVGINQVNYIKEKFKIENVKYIPHGIDTKFFVPGTMSNRIQNRLLFVGQHMRDFDALNYCVPVLAERIKDLSVHVVLHPAYENHVKYHDCISIFTAMNDVQLRNEYQEASALFLPMIDSTACNSILEAIACGLVVITNDVGGNAKYLEDTNSLMIPKDDFDTMIAATCQLLQDEEGLKLSAQKTRAKAMTYDWNLISDEIINFHNSLW